MKPKQCYGPRPEQHASGCRPGRPLCRWRRAKSEKYRPCCCGIYGYPHRINSGRCGNPALMEAFVYGPQLHAP